MERKIEVFYIKILQRLAKAGRCMYFKINNEEKSGFNKINLINKHVGVIKGAPDIIVIAKNNRCFFIQFKDLSKKLRQEQEKIKKELKFFNTKVLLINEYNSKLFIDILLEFNILTEQEYFLNSIYGDSNAKD